ncbi:alpha-galactosidase [Microbacterium sp. BDGP8]|uniref:alpha-galactosidase n=1 Tax=Microbacterium sp. BDGP8 TaxID=3035531 RepID=UPI00249F5DDB|nr:alpha-galactosidase [Microbacterium sp. BDGP8]WHE35317.1 alpha-galactosidase [Microbacterium sp. BDGP8]
MDSMRVIHLNAEDVSVVIATADDGMPEIVHWGEAVTSAEPDLLAFVAAEQRNGMTGDSDVPYRASVLPEHSRGWFGAPGLSAHRDGSGWAPRFVLRSLALDGAEAGPGVTSGGAGRVDAVLHDDAAEIELGVEIDLTRDGLVRSRARVRNTAGATEAAAPLEIQSLAVALPIPTWAQEVLDFTGRWGHERIPQRHPVVRGDHSRVSRRGRTGLDATLVQAVGTPGFSAGSGEVWIGHVGFSGDHEHTIERTDGRLHFRGGESILPGEIRLTPGEEYTGPWVFGSYGRGLDGAAARFHSYLRERSRSSRRPRPVTMNVWEAVYFDHDHRVLVDLAARAAELGVERYVLDDGWFRGRNDDRAGLGDWAPDPIAWPDGLRPLADEVRSLGMEFGLWVEPEMINEDSDLARAHPEWILRAGPELPPRQRFQQVLDLTHPAAFDHILGVLDGLIEDIGVSYLKWDHNRDLIAAGHPASGAPAVHEQTLAVYRLIDELRRRHPDLEIESCASGGGRVDLGILERTDRIHPSDSHDPHDRFGILRWTGLLVPPEMMGSHVASPVSSVTGRAHDLQFRCAVAFLGHFGIEWDIRDLDEHDRRVLGDWIARYRRHRHLIATGRTVGSGELDAAAPQVRGVVAPNGSEALFTIVTPTTSADTIARVRFPGLSTDRSYRVSVSGSDSFGPPWQVPAWLRESPELGGDGDGDGERVGDGPVIAGTVLARVGLEFPTFHPDRAAVVHLAAVAAP